VAASLRGLVRVCDRTVGWPKPGTRRVLAALATLLSALIACSWARAANEELASQSALDRLTLHDAERLLRDHNRDLKAAERAVESSRAALLSAGARQNPNLTMQTSNINPHVGIGAGGLQDKAFDTQLRVDYLLERGGKRDLRIASASALERASAYDTRDTLRNQRAAMAASYYDLLLAQERVRITHESAELFAGSLSASRRRLAAGDIAASDVDRMAVDALRARSDEEVAAVDRLHAQVNLGGILGLERYAEKIVAADGWPEPQTLPSDLDLDAVAESRADVKAARERVEAASRARELARSQRTRDVTVAVTYDHWPTNGANLQGTGNSYGFSVSIPLFLGNHFDGDIAKAEVDWGTALDALEKTAALARADLVRSRLDLESAGSRVTRYDQELLASAKRAADAQEFAYERGAIGLLDLLDARRTLRSVQLDATAARADYAKALAAWRQARALDGEE